MALHVVSELMDVFNVSSVEWTAADGVPVLLLAAHLAVVMAGDTISADLQPHNATLDDLGPVVSSLIVQFAVRQHDSSRRDVLAYALPLRPGRWAVVLQASEVSEPMISLSAVVQAGSLQALPKCGSPAVPVISNPHPRRSNRTSMPVHWWARSHPALVVDPARRIPRSPFDRMPHRLLNRGPNDNAAELATELRSREHPLASLVGASVNDDDDDDDNHALQDSDLIARALRRLYQLQNPYNVDCDRARLLLLRWPSSSQLAAWPQEQAIARVSQVLSTALGLAALLNRTLVEVPAGAGESASCGSFTRWSCFFEPLSDACPAVSHAVASLAPRVPWSAMRHPLDIDAPPELRGFAILAQDVEDVRVVSLSDWLWRPADEADMEAQWAQVATSASIAQAWVRHEAAHTAALAWRRALRLFVWRPLPWVLAALHSVPIESPGVLRSSDASAKSLMDWMHVAHRWSLGPRRARNVLAVVTDSSSSECVLRAIAALVSEEAALFSTVLLPESWNMAIAPCDSIRCVTMRVLPETAVTAAEVTPESTTASESSEVARAIAKLTAMVAARAVIGKCDLDSVIARLVADLMAALGRLDVLPLSCGGGVCDESVAVAWQSVP